MVSTRDKIKAIMACEPELGAHGFGRGSPHSLMSDESFASERANMLTPWYCEQFELALQFLEHVRCMKKIDPDAHSYWLKHCVESWHKVRRTQGYDSYYCSNGMFIAAALSRGFKHHRWKGLGSINCCFNIDAEEVARVRRAEVDAANEKGGPLVTDSGTALN